MIQERVLVRQGKRAIKVPAIEVLLYKENKHFKVKNVSEFENSPGRSSMRKFKKFNQVSDISRSFHLNKDFIKD